MSNQSQPALFSRLTATRGETWAARGYRLVDSADGYAVEGDLGQFYCDAVANDVDAAVALQFLRESGSATWADVRELAEDDGIDLDESQEILLLGKPLPVVVAGLS